jgi:hypothetical protein
MSAGPVHSPPEHEQATRGDPASQNAYRDPAPLLAQLSHKRTDKRHQNEEHCSKTNQDLGSIS